MGIKHAPKPAIKSDDPFILVMRVESTEGGGGWVFTPVPHIRVGRLLEEFRETVAPAQIVRSSVIKNTEAAFERWARQSGKSRKEFDLS